MLHYNSDVGESLAGHRGSTYQANGKVDRNREQLLLVVSDDGLQAGIQGFQLGLVAKLKKVCTRVSILNVHRDVTILALYEFADLRSDGVADCMLRC